MSLFARYLFYQINNDNMEEKNTSSHDNSWLLELDKKLAELGAKRGNFLQGKTYLYIPGNKCQKHHVATEEHLDTGSDPIDIIKPEK